MVDGTFWSTGRVKGESMHRPQHQAREERHDTAAVVRAHGPLVWSLCRRMAANPEDGYQSAWEKILRGLPRFDPDGPASLRTWIGTVVHRHLVDLHRRGQTRGQLVPLGTLPPVDPGVDEHLAARQQLVRLELALQRLPLAQRRAVVMHHIEGRGLAELAREEGVALGTMKSRLHRARGRLAQWLGGVK